jgi:hypothetical protein
MLHNDTSDPQDVTLSVALPGGWTELSGTARYPIAPHQTYPVEAILASPATKSSDWHEVTWTAAARDAAVGSITLRVQLSFGGLPQ